MYINVHVDEDDVLSELSDNVLLKELKRRKLKHESTPSEKECKSTLADAAFALRKAGKINLAWRLDEISHDYF